MNMKIPTNKRKPRRVKTAIKGIYEIQDFDIRTGNYRKRETGLRYVAIKRVGKRQIEKSFPSLREAQAWKYSDEYDTKKVIELMTFGQVCEKYFAHIQSEVRPTTFRAYIKLMPHLKSLSLIPINRFNSSIIDQWLKELKSPEYLKGNKSTRLSYNHELELVGRVFNHAKEYIDERLISPILKRHTKDAVIDGFKMQIKRAKDSEKYLNQMEIDAFINELVKESDHDSISIYAIIAMVQLDIGPRIGETLALDWSNICFKQAKVKVTSSVQFARYGLPLKVNELTKSGVNRTIPINPEGNAYIHLKKMWLNMGCPKSGLVFNDNGKPYTYRKVQYRYDRALEASSIKYRGTHLMRHTMATNFNEQTGDLVSLQSILGHSTPAMTRRYAKTTTSSMVRAMSNYSASNVIKFEPKKDEPMLGNAGTG